MNPLYSMESPVRVTQPRTPVPPAVKMGRKNYAACGTEASMLSTSVSDMSQDDREGSLQSLGAQVAAGGAPIRNHQKYEQPPPMMPSLPAVPPPYTPKAPHSGSLDRSATGPYVRRLIEGEVRGGSEREPRRRPSVGHRAPTPPLHRCPSWVSSLGVTCVHQILFASVLYVHRSLISLLTILQRIPGLVSLLCHYYVAGLHAFWFRLLHSGG